jgi:hypothetical protein
MTANVEGMVRSAVEAIRAGKKADARTLLERALELDEYNEEAWLWLSSVVDSVEEQRTCLDNVLVINPTNAKARAGLKALGVDPDASAPPPTASAFGSISDDDLFPSTPAFASGGQDDLFSDLDFGATPNSALSFDDDEDDIIATSSASSTFAKPQATPDEYDDWISNLGIGNKGSKSTPPTVDSTAFGMDDDDFFSPTPAPSAPTTSSGTANPFGEDPFGTDPFASEPSFAVPAVAYDEDDFIADNASFDDIISTPSNESFENLFDSNLLGDVDLDSGEGEGGDELEAYFNQIPSEIKAGRLPGTDEDTPVGLLVGVGVTVLLNLGAAVFLLTRLG